MDETHSARYRPPPSVYKKMHCGYEYRATIYFKTRAEAKKIMNMFINGEGRDLVGVRWDPPDKKFNEVLGRRNFTVSFELPLKNVKEIYYSFEDGAGI